MSFLPKDFKEPVQSNYMDFEEGDNTFRALDSATVGWEYWVERVIDGKTVNRPVRVKEHDSIPLNEVVEDRYGKLNYSFFWAFPVYSFDNRKIQILTIKQKTVRRPMLKSINNPKWGDPKDYNFVVSRDKDENGKTVYTVTTEPKEKLDSNILEKYKSMNIDMEVWMKGEDPFKNVSQEEVGVDTGEVADEAFEALASEDESDESMPNF